MSEPYLGEVRIFGGTFAPAGWAMCDGQLLSIAEYDALFALIGTTYGGDGQTTFAVPDLRGRLILNAGMNPQTGTNYVQAQAGGSETVTLTPQQLPAHTHAANCQTNTGSQAGPANNFWAKTSGGTQYQVTTAAAGMAASAITPSGGNQPHENMMPFLPLTYIIALQGNWPSQN